MLHLIPKLFCTLLLLWGMPLFSQTYITNGSATQDNCNCYTLTTSTMNQSGSVWNKTKLDVTEPFDLKFNVFLGCGDSPGADGIAFILQTSANSVGRNGSGLGFAGVTPSIGIALDTYQNTMTGDVNNDLNDPVFDHISIQANGQVRHGADLANPVPASATNNNIEDCNWHVLRISWAPATKTLNAYFDGVFRVGATVDLVNDIFRNYPDVYWGFSASTGGEYNVQRFCTALNPGFTTNLTNDGACIGQHVSFNDQSLSFAPITAYYWNFGDGTTSTEANPAAHTYREPGEYPVRLAITGLDGCNSDTLEKVITIGSIPDAAFTVNDACFKTAPQIQFGTTNIGTSYQWLVDGLAVSTDAHPPLTEVAAGSHALQRRVLSDYGCGTDEATQPLTIKPAPVIQTAAGLGVCTHLPTTYTASLLNNDLPIQQWRWTFGDGQQAFTQNPVHVYSRTGSYTAQVWALAVNGCASDTVALPVTVYEAFADAGRDTIVLNSTPFTLQGSGNGSVTWEPSAGLNRTDILNPIGTLTDDQQYWLTVTSPEGCKARDSVKIEVFKGSAVYVPSAFTPNGDGRNDQLLPLYKGIRKLYYFTIYNRWGQPVFSTADRGRGWDGLQGGKAVATGSFVWMVRAEDVVGHVYQLKGTFVLIR
jgi:gliding motility-associated-like protein